jgi:hypothetical protein
MELGCKEEKEPTGNQTIRRDKPQRKLGLCKVTERGRRGDVQWGQCSWDNKEIGLELEIRRPLGTFKIIFM